MVSVQLDYDNRFKKRRSKPFDLFWRRTVFGWSSANTLGGRVNYVTGYGLLFGRNRQAGKLSLLTGAFQDYDY
jgi:hypothetical protein